MARENDLAKTFAQRRAEAREHLRREMTLLGLREEDGWRIFETIRQNGARTELHMRPVHLHLPTPEGVECVIDIDEGEAIEMHCEP